MIQLLTLLTLMINTSMTTMSVTSPAFTVGTMIPSKYTCEGKSTSPALHINYMPGTTVSLAIITHDPDAGQAGFTHWVAWNITPAADIPENFTGGVEGTNGASKTGYMGPCPPTGTHHYHFMVFALDTMLTLPTSTDKAGLEKAMAGHIIARADLVGLYKKMNP
jgi:Raf kinase inhibitor-like YbhB/YbcL family protein